MVTGVANGIGRFSATLNGTANPNGGPTTGRFAYGLTASYSATTPVQALGSGIAAVAIGGGAITGLACGTLYHFRATATNAEWHHERIGRDVHDGGVLRRLRLCPTSRISSRSGHERIDGRDRLHGRRRRNGGPARSASPAALVQQALVPNANIVFSGSGANRTVTVAPAEQRRTATIP